MKICFPISNNQGLESIVNAHFGSTKEFLIYDSDTNSHEIINNSHAEHAHGKCNFQNTLRNRQIGIVIAGGLGMRALLNLHALDVKVLKAVNGSVRKNLNKLFDSELREITAEEACLGHAYSQICDH